MLPTVPTEQELRENPFGFFPVGEDEVVWFDRDTGLFLRGPHDPNEGGEADEYATYAELAAAS